VGKDGPEAGFTNYVDDMYVAGICTFARHLEDMDLVFGRLQQAGFGARMDKAEFCRHSISMLGWTVAEGQKSAQTEKLETIDKLIDECKDVKDVLSLLGTIGFYRQLISMSEDIEAPLYDLTRKGAWKEGAWTPVHTACVALLKYHLKEQVKLALPRIGNDPTGKPYPPIHLITDAYSMRVVLFCFKNGRMEWNGLYVLQAGHLQKSKGIGVQPKENCRHYSILLQSISNSISLELNQTHTLHKS
jgi:hypothetical protein